MKLLFLTVITALLIPSGLVAQQEEDRKLQPFSKLSVEGNINVYLEHGDTEHAQLNVTGIAPNQVITEVTNNQLEINLLRRSDNDARVNIFLTYRSIDNITVSKSARVSLQDTLKAAHLTINGSTGGEVDADVQADSLTLNLRKGGTVLLRGKSKFYEANLRSGSTLGALGHTTETAHLRITTRSIAKVNATGMLEANIRSWGSLTYTGEPDVKNIKTGIGASILSQ